MEDKLNDKRPFVGLFIFS